ncbi:MAG: polyphosphate polymerase domain-containing protein [Ruminococcus sp.]|nr:polyphosphate polymerase domain-containing protein [Ruminococcus sp.]
MAQEVFKRTEKKYLLEQATYNELVRRLSYYMNRDKFYESNIISLYYDTPDYRLIRTSIEKPVFKEKIRLRSYGVPTSEDTVFLEIKRKYKGVVYKRRSVMPLDDAMKFTHGRQITPHNAQIEHELKWAFDYYEDLAPRMFISYHRLAFSGKDDSNLRITFDNHIIYRDFDLDPSKGIYGRELLKDGQRLMEIKIPDAMPLWLSDILDDLKIYSTSYSKYGKAYLTLLGENALGKHSGLSVTRRAI